MEKYEIISKIDQLKQMMEQLADEIAGLQLQLIKLESEDSGT